MTLTNEMAEDVRTKVASREYASESEVIREGPRALQARRRALDHWLRHEVIASYDALEADPSHGSSLEDARAALRERHARASAE